MCVDTFTEKESSGWEGQAETVRTAAQLRAYSTFVPRAFRKFQNPTASTSAIEGLAVGGAATDGENDGVGEGHSAIGRPRRVFRWFENMHRVRTGMFVSPVPRFWSPTEWRSQAHSSKSRHCVQEARFAPTSPH